MQKYLEKENEIGFDKLFNQILGYLLFKDFCESMSEEPVPQLKFYEEVRGTDDHNISFTLLKQYNYLTAPPVLITCTSHPIPSSFSSPIATHFIIIIIIFPFALNTILLLCSYPLLPTGIKNTNTKFMHALVLLLPHGRLFVCLDGWMGGWVDGWVIR